MSLEALPKACDVLSPFCPHPLHRLALTIFHFISSQGLNDSVVEQPPKSRNKNIQGDQELVGGK